MKHPRPQLNTADPAQLDAASDLLDEGEAPDLGILIAARQERLRGGLSRYTVQGLVTLGRLSDQKRETHRLVLIADWARDNDPNGRYPMTLERLREISPINATRCDADDEYRQARWLNAEMLYRAAAAATESEGARDEWLDRARDSRRQAFRDGLVHDDPGPSTRVPQNDWDWAMWRAGRGIGNARHRTMCMASLRMCRNDSAAWRGLWALCAFREPVQPPRSDVPNLPPSMAGVSLQAAALVAALEAAGVGEG